MNYYHIIIIVILIIINNNNNYYYYLPRWTRPSHCCSWDIDRDEHTLDFHSISCIVARKLCTKNRTNWSTREQAVAWLNVLCCFLVGIVFYPVCVLLFICVSIFLRNRSILLCSGCKGHLWNGPERRKM